jgi:hypothetical protein
VYWISSRVPARSMRRAELPTSSSGLASASYEASRAERRYRAVDPDNTVTFFVAPRARGTLRDSYFEVRGYAWLRRAICKKAW